MTDYGCILTLHVADRADQVKSGDGKPVMVALTDRQLLAAITDIEAAVTQLEDAQWGRPSLVQRIFGRRGKR